MTLILMRHPQPRGASGCCYGRTELDVDPGRLERAAAAARRRLQEHAVSVVYSSPSQRCRTLAEQLAPGTVRAEPALRELDFGAWEGRPWEAIARSELDAWAADIWHYRPGGGESAAALAARLCGWLATLSAGRGTALAVTHAGVIRVALVLAGRAAPAQLGALAVPFESLHVLELAADTDLDARTRLLACAP